MFTTFEAMAFDPRHPPLPAIQRALCALLIDRADAIDWAAFTPADWQQFIPIVQAEGVLALVWWSLSATGCPHAVPDQIRHALQLGAYQALAQSMLMYEALDQIAAALPTQQVLVLKGAALGSTLYRARVLRPLSDIDLLVPEGQLAAITEQLTVLGYEAVPELTTGLNQQIEYHTRLEGGPRRRVAVELHWRLVAGHADWRSPATGWFWQQREPWQPRDRQAPDQSLQQLSPTAHLLYLAAHLMLQHGAAQSRLIWFYDLHLLITQTGDRIDWRVLVDQARAFRWSAALHAALLGTHTRFGTPLPAHVLHELESTDDQQAATFVQEKAAAAPDALVNEWVKLRSLDRRARWRFVASVICPNPTYIRWRYQPRPASIWPLFYPCHWLRVVVDGVRLVRHLRWHAQPLPDRRPRA